MPDQAKVLLIDDEPDIREMLQYQLENAGFEVSTAENGVEGLDRLKSFEPDLIVLDLNMPQMGGIEFYKNICDEDNNAQYPIIALTAQEEIDDLFEGFNIEAYIPKPFDITKLVKTARMMTANKSS